MASVEKSRRNQSTDRNDNGHRTCVGLQKSRMINRKNRKSLKKMALSVFMSGFQITFVQLLVSYGDQVPQIRETVLQGFQRTGKES